MSAPLLNGEHLILRGVIELPRWGAWHAELEVDAFEAPEGEVTIEDGALSLIGTVHVATKEGGRCLVTVVGGADGLSQRVSAKQYVGATVGLILEDIARESGETLDPGLPDSVRRKLAPHWTRRAGSAGSALSALTDYLGAEHCWRYQANGTLWLGTDTWEELDLDDVVLLNQGPSTGSREYGSSAGQALALVPGVTFDGQQLTAVVHHIEPERVRTVVYVSESRERLKGAATAALDALLGRKLDYLALYPCTVAAQDGQTLDLTPDDDRIKGSGLQRVPIWHGLPGVEVTVDAGSRCLLGFRAGDPSRPYAALWSTPEASVTRLDLGAGLAQVVRVGDTITGAVSPGSSGSVVITSVARVDLQPPTKVYA